MKNAIVRSILIASSLVTTLNAAILPIVAPNSKTTTQAGQASLALFGNADWTFQWLTKSTQFSTVPIGSKITGIGFRLDSADVNSPTNPYTLPSWNLQLSSSPNAVGSLSTNFASNTGADAVTAFSGPLVIPANSFKNGTGGGPKPFFVITLTTPYTYQGGNLLATLRKQGAGPNLWVDAGNVDATVDTVATGSFTATTGVAHNFNYPVTEFLFSTPTPEPSTDLLLGSGLIGLIGVARRRK